MDEPPFMNDKCEKKHHESEVCDGSEDFVKVNPSSCIYFLAMRHLLCFTMSTTSFFFNLRHVHVTDHVYILRWKMCFYLSKISCLSSREENLCSIITNLRNKLEIIFPKYYLCPENLNLNKFRCLGLLHIWMRSTLS